MLMNDSPATSPESEIEEAAVSPVPVTEAAAEPDLAAELAAMKALADERLAELAYARAEIDNVRKRAFKSADERLSSGRKALLGKFIPVLDNLQRALAFNDSDGLRGGLQATLKQFEVALAAEGIVPVETLGLPFDPRVAEAIATRESKDHEDEIVVEDVQRGYRLGDELLRPAMVIVAKHVSD